MRTRMWSKNEKSFLQAKTETLFNPVCSVPSKLSLFYLLWPINKSVIFFFFSTFPYWRKCKEAEKIKEMQSKSAVNENEAKRLYQLEPSDTASEGLGCILCAKWNDLKPTVYGFQMWRSNNGFMWNVQAINQENSMCWLLYLEFLNVFYQFMCIFPIFRGKYWGKELWGKI